MGFSVTPGGGFTFPRQETQYPQVDLQEVKSFIDQGSVAIRYWKAMECPCTTPSSGQPNIACPTCRGLGFAYDAPEADPDYCRALVHSRRSNRMNDKGGFLVQGYASITFKIGIIPADGDLVQVCADREVVNDEYHIVGSILQDGSSAETLRFRDVFCIERIKILDQATKKVITADPTSWEFDPASRQVKWLNGQALGTKYSVRYQARPEFVILGQSVKPLLRVSHDDSLPDPLRTKLDIVYPYNVQALRLDRAVIQRMRGAQDLSGEPTTFNNKDGRGPFLE